MKVRYIRESMSGNNENAFCHWVEIQAINYESTNIALNKKATCVGGNPEKGTLDMITNGNTSVDDYVYFRNVAEQTIFVTVDLGTVEDVDNIKVWHYYVNGRTYKNILLEVSLDGVKWTKIFDSNENGEYVEVEAGKTHKLKDDRLPLLNENSSLNEVTSFYEKYIKQDISNKEFLKNVLTSKEIECNDDKMLNLINKVGNIEIGKKWASGTVTSSSATIQYKSANGATTNNKHYSATINNLSFVPSVVIVYGRFTTSSSGSAKINMTSVYCKHFNNYAVTMQVADEYSSVNTYALPVLLDMIESEAILEDGIIMPVYGKNTNMASRTYNWIAFE